MNPRTATAQTSIWQPVGEEQFHCNLSRLWKATRGRPNDPKTYPIPRQIAEQVGAFPIALELQLSNGIAFISSVKKGVEFVFAVAIQLPRDASNGLKLNLAANEKISQAVTDCLDHVVTIVRKAAREGDLTFPITMKHGHWLIFMTETNRLQCKDDILASVLQLNRPRIHGRLKSKKNRHLVRDGLHSILLSLQGRPASPHHAHLVQRLEALCQALEGYCFQEKLQTIESLKSLVAACYSFFSNLPSGESMKSALHHAGVDVDESQGNPHLRQIGKTASIYHLAETLSMIASHHEFRRFCVNLSVRYVPAYRTVPLPVLAVDGGSRDCRLHAEVQLVVDLDLRRTSKWDPPRVIGSSKAPCFLCETFINEHGRYFVPRTHGKLTPRWTIPDLDEFSQSQRSHYQEIIRRMNRMLQEPVSSSLLRRVDPAMSWQAFSQLNLSPFLDSSVNQINSVLPRVRQISAGPGMSQVSRKGQPLPAIELPEPSVLAISDELKLPESQTRLHTRISLLEKPQVGTSEHCLNSTLEIDKRDMLRRTLLGEAGSRSSSNVENCCGGRHLPEPKRQRQARSCMNLGPERLTQVTQVIRDHESRACGMLFECGINGKLKRCLSSMPHSNNMNRRIDFHDTELFLEVEYPNTAQMVIIQCLRPEKPKTHRVIDIDKLEPGASLEVDTGESLTGNRVMFLTKIDKMGTDQWWECLWRRKDELQSPYSPGGGSPDEG